MKQTKKAKRKPPLKSGSYDIDVTMTPTAGTSIKRSDTLHRPTHEQADLAVAVLRTERANDTLRAIAIDVLDRYLSADLNPWVAPYTVTGTTGSGGMLFANTTTSR